MQNMGIDVLGSAINGMNKKKKRPSSRKERLPYHLDENTATFNEKNNETERKRRGRPRAK